MKALGKSPLCLVGSVFGIAAAYVVSLALAGAYSEGEILDVLLSLAIPPLVLFFVYEGSDKRAVFCLGSLMISATLFKLSPQFGVSHAGVNLVLITIASMALPVVLDLLFIDMGQRLEFDHASARLTQVAFLAALLPVAATMLIATHQTVLQEDVKLIGELASRLTPEGDTLVVDLLDPRLREKAQRRIAIRAKDKTFRLADADIESTREQRSYRKENRARGVESDVTWEQQARMRLILNLQGTPIPDDVVIFSRRGPLTIYEVRVPLARRGNENQG